MKNRTQIVLQNIQTVFHQIASGKLVVPDFQRNFAWNKDQVKDLLESIYQGFPIGTILVLEDRSNVLRFRRIDQSSSTDFGTLEAPNYSTLWYVLDGSQRLEALFRIFFQDQNVDFDLYFDLEKEEFISNRRNARDPKIVKLRDLYSPDGFSQSLASLFQIDKSGLLVDKYNNLHATFRDYELLFQVLIDMSLDEAMEVFARTNTRGRALTKHDLDRVKRSGS